jgi:hypothetical protein
VPCYYEHLVFMQEVTGWTLDVLSQASWWDRYHVW